jgi:hypothetical protein
MRRSQTNKATSWVADLVYNNMNAVAYDAGGDLHWTVLIQVNKAVWDGVMDKFGPAVLTEKDSFSVRAKHPGLDKFLMRLT